MTQGANEMNKIIVWTVTAAALSLSVNSAFAGPNAIPTLGPYGQQPPNNQVRQLPPLSPPPASSSGAWVRPYTAGDGGVGAMGGYQSRGGTSVTGNVYVPNNGTPSGGVSVTVPTR
jgi:hypothetical protein